MATKEEWQGRVGQVWAAQATALDGLLSPVGDVALNELGNVKAQRILDLGCGSGDSTAKLANAGAKVTGVDVSLDLLEAARKRVVDNENKPNFIHADASAVPLGGPYDVLYSRCGCMFFDDPISAWGHLRREVGYDCRLMLVAWSSYLENDWAKIPMLAADGVLDDELIAPPKDGVIGPFAWADEGLITKILSTSKWCDLDVQPVTKKVCCALGEGSGLEQGVNFCMKIGPLASRLKNTDHTIKSEIALKLEDILAEYVEDGAVWLNSCAWIIKGRS